MPRAALPTALLLVIALACVRYRRPAPDPARPGTQAASSQRDWYEPTDIESPARPYIGNPLPQFPEAMLVAPGTKHTVRVEFVVRKDGTVDPDTFRSLTPDADPRLVSAIRDAVLRWRYDPAWDRGQAVRMIIRYAFDFVEQPRRSARPVGTRD